MRDSFDEILTRDRPLAALTTWRIGGLARRFYEPRNAKEAAGLLAALEAAGQGWRVLGGGANVLIDDRPHETPFVSPARLQEFTIDGRLVTVGAGTSFPKVVADTVAQGLAGCEVLAGVPGQMGGICVMNAGGRHGEVKDVVDWLEIARLTGEVERLSADACHFGYRSSRLGPGLVCRVGLELARTDDVAALRRYSGAILKAKAASQPLREPSGGCCFANPSPELSAGQLIDELGLKGTTRGDAAISDKHANFIVNRGEARFDEVLELMELIERRALDERGIRLRRETAVWRA
ncbi:MAG: UDP-N-acetylmuramate dehydrogenase [Planctomycetes bacterium]|nr:UDP-N-acetylmuramate dehydrogenase [Planctomycetota bacterium]